MPSAATVGAADPVGAAIAHPVGATVVLSPRGGSTTAAPTSGFHTAGRAYSFSLLKLHLPGGYALGCFLAILAFLVGGGDLLSYREKP